MIWWPHAQEHWNWHFSKLWTTWNRDWLQLNTKAFLLDRFHSGSIRAREREKEREKGEIREKGERKERGKKQERNDRERREDRKRERELLREKERANTQVWPCRNWHTNYSSHSCFELGRYVMACMFFHRKISCEFSLL